MSMSMKDKLLECLLQQVSEFELLQSMYPNRDDISVTENTLDKIKEFINQPCTEYTPNHLDFVLNLNVSGLKLEICINLPSFYPEDEPDIYVRCNQLDRKQESCLNSELTSYIKKNHLNEVSLYNAVCWLQENVELFSKKLEESSSQKINTTNIEQEKFSRVWVYSHHIYNKRKREDILKLAKEYNITGFCLPGKPGIICIEGTDIDCKEWWRNVKSMTWKKIVIRKTESFQLSERLHHQRFEKFQELHFPSANLSKNSKHADMSEFYKYIDLHKLTQDFNDFFGLCND